MKKGGEGGSIVGFRDKTCRKDPSQNVTSSDHTIIKRKTYPISVTFFFILLESNQRVLLTLRKLDKN